MSRLRPQTRAPKAPKAPKSPKGDAADSGFLRGVLIGALGGLVAAFAGMQLLGGPDPVPVTPAPAPYAESAPATGTFLDQSLDAAAVDAGGE